MVWCHSFILLLGNTQTIDEHVLLNSGQIFTHCENVYNAQRDNVNNCTDSCVKWCLNSDCQLVGY